MMIFHFERAERYDRLHQGVVLLFYASTEFNQKETTMLQDVQDYLSHKWDEFSGALYDLLGYNEHHPNQTITQAELQILDHISALMFMNLQNQLTKWQITKKHRHQLSDLLQNYPDIANKLNNNEILNGIYQEAKKSITDIYQITPDAFNKQFDGNIHTLLSV